MSPPAPHKNQLEYGYTTASWQMAIFPPNPWYKCYWFLSEDCFIIRPNHNVSRPRFSSWWDFILSLHNRPYLKGGYSEGRMFAGFPDMNSFARGLCGHHRCDVNGPTSPPVREWKQEAQAHWAFSFSEWFSDTSALGLLFLRRILCPWSNFSTVCESE